MQNVQPSEPIRQPEFLPEASSQPLPPIHIVSQVEATRHGTSELTTEVSEHVQVTPPIRQRTPPPAIYIDSRHLKTPVFMPRSSNDTTWISNPPDIVGLAPPVTQKPMTSPAYPSYEPMSPAQKAMHDAFWPELTSLTPPVSQKPMSTPIIASKAEHSFGHAPYATKNPSNGRTSGAYDISRPTCSLNLVCYRGGTEGCILRQLQTVSASRFTTQAAFATTMRNNPGLIATDEALFLELRKSYNEMSGFRRRYLSLKTLTGLRLLSVR